MTADTESDEAFLNDMEAWVTGSLVFKAEHRTRLFALARRGAAVQWRPIEEAPKEPVEEGWTRGPLIYVQPAWGGWDIGWWDLRLNCFRMTGDDGPGDEQPTHWMPLPPPPAGEPKEVLRPDRRTNVAERLFGDD